MDVTEITKTIEAGDAAGRSFVIPGIDWNLERYAQWGLFGPERLPAYRLLGMAPYVDDYVPVLVNVNLCTYVALREASPVERNLYDGFFDLPWPTRLRVWEISA